MPAKNKSSPVLRESNKGYEYSSDYLQAIINSLEDELIVIDPDYRIVQANEAVLIKHGKRREEVIGEYCYEISHGLPELCQPPRHECPIKVVWEIGKPARTTHLHLYESHGERRERYVDIIASPITDREGKVVAVVELMRDVTEAKELEFKLAEANRNLVALNTIASVVSQSLNLNKILGNAVDRTLEIMRVNASGILLLDEERQVLRYEVSRGFSRNYVAKTYYKMGAGIIGGVAQTGEPIVIDDVLAGREPRDSLAMEGMRALVCVPLRAKEKSLGALIIASRDFRRFSAEDVRLLESIAAQIAISVENAKLHKEVRYHDEIRGELLREIFSIQEEERKRIARELHDDTMQSLASLAANLEAVASMLPVEASKVKGILKGLQSLSIGTLDEIHRLIYKLRPTLLDDLGLVAATRWLAENNLGTAGIKVNFRVAGGERRLYSSLETTLFRVIQEAISNIARHAHATHAQILINFKRGSIQVQIRDDGVGFDFEEAINSKDRPRGLGLLGMKERAGLFNGSFTITSSPGGGGTKINVKIPIDYEVTNGK